MNFLHYTKFPLSRDKSVGICRSLPYILKLLYSLLALLFHLYSSILLYSSISLGSHSPNAFPHKSQHWHARGVLLCMEISRISAGHHSCSEFSFKFSLSSSSSHYQQFQQFAQSLISKQQTTTHRLFFQFIFPTNIFEFFPKYEFREHRPKILSPINFQLQFTFIIHDSALNLLFCWMTNFKRRVRFGWSIKSWTKKNPILWNLYGIY